jgi:hypothetical protein
MSSSIKTDLVREIAERIDDGRPVNLRYLSRGLGVPYDDLLDAYEELARQRGVDPLLDRARRRLAAARRPEPPRTRWRLLPEEFVGRRVRHAERGQADEAMERGLDLINRMEVLAAKLEALRRDSGHLRGTERS